MGQTEFTQGTPEVEFALRWVKTGIVTGIVHEKHQLSNQIDRPGDSHQKPGKSDYETRVSTVRP